MRHFFKIAENLVAVTVDEELAAWREISSHYAPFEVTTVEVPLLDINVTVGPLAVTPPGECVYEPDRGLGFITGRAWRQKDDSTIIEFLDAEDLTPRLWLKLSRELNKAEITIGTEDKGIDGTFLTHAMMIAFAMATCHTGTLVIHASTVIWNGRAYLFQGKSGTGKSTHAGLWVANVEGAELLNDDNPVIRFSAEGTATAYGSPWSGKTHCYRNISAPIGAFVRIVRGERNELVGLTPLRAYASLTSSIFGLPIFSDRLKELRHLTIERLATAVPCAEMHCRPDADAALTCAAAVHPPGVTPAQ